MLVPGVPNRGGRRHGLRVEPFDSAHMLDCAVAEGRETRKICAAAVEILLPGDPVRPLDEFVRVPLHASHALGKCTGRNRERAPTRMIGHFVQERVSQRLDAGRNHVLDRAQIDDEVDFVRCDVMVVQEGLKLDLEVALLEFMPR